MRLPYRFSTAGHIATDLSAVTMIGHLLTWSRARPRDMTSRHAGDLRLQMRRRFDDLRQRLGWKFATLRDKGAGGHRSCPDDCHTRYALRQQRYVPLTN